MVEVHHAVLCDVYESVGVEVVEVGLVPAPFSGFAVGSARAYWSDACGEVHAPCVAGDRAFGKAGNAQYGLRLPEQRLGEVAVQVGAVV